MKLMFILKITFLIVMPGFSLSSCKVSPDGGSAVLDSDDTLEHNRGPKGGGKGTSDVALTNAPAVFQINTRFPDTSDYLTSEPPFPNMDALRRGNKAAGVEWLEKMQAYIYEGMNDQSRDPNLNFRIPSGTTNIASQRWYHMPWLHSAKYSEDRPGRGRDTVWGLTREVDLRDSSGTCLGQNWGIGFFNEPAGFALGKIFQPGSVELDGSRNSDGSIFPVGSVSFKVLFTTAVNLPEYDDAYEITANINAGGVCIRSGVSEKRSLTKMRLIQMDVMMKVGPKLDDWVFGVWTYNKNQKANPKFWQGMEPVGVQYDPTISGTIITSTDLKPNGLHGRLNGPADNPLSSCLSCHARAQWPELSYGRLPFAPRNENDQKMICLLHDWGGEGTPGCPSCPNGGSCIPQGGAPIAPDGKNLDYSLQLALALRNRSIAIGGGR